ncbi:hypothetical protein EJ07DRAFT_168939 [Lizonia empirigonia]|nr:hypothetical protein EJ07DRAFT_168939 [Lizonia empirigonia]
MKCQKIDGDSSYVRVTVGGKLAGNAFACRWDVDGRTICWITQLVVQRSINTVSLNFIKDNAESIMKASPVDYAPNAQLRGSLFHAEDGSGLVSCADTGFFVDHEEPLEALAWVREIIDWPLGELLGGHEFIMIIETRRRSRSRSRSVRKGGTT